MSDLRFHLQGQHAEATAEALEAFFSETFAEAARREPVRQPHPVTPERSLDPVAVAALIVSIPSGVLAVMDLAERLKLKEKIARLTTLARREWREHGTRIWLQRRNATPLALDAADPAAILDAAASERER